MQQKTVIVIAGPTAVGKTSFAIQLAQHFHTHIISADSRQCYKELNIGVARPPAAQLAQVPHYFIASHSIHQKVTAATFEQYALEKVYGLFKKLDVVVMVGGTGLYIKAFCEGLDVIPPVPEAVQQEVERGYATHGLTWLQTELAHCDPAFFATAEQHNPHRLMRALEVFRATGKSINTFRNGSAKQRDFKIIKVALSLPKEELHQNINKRVDEMMQEGLLQEVENLVAHQQLNALQTVGYKEIFSFLKGEITMQAAVDKIKQNTRQYAKRQLTWFRKDKAYQWYHPAQVSQLIKALENKPEIDAL